MRDYAPNEFMEVIAEKRVRSASKGRSQWLFLKKFDGKRVIDFIEAAKLESRRQAPGTYQDRNWWDRELDYCLKKGVIRIVRRPSEPPATRPTGPEGRLASPQPLPGDTAPEPALATPLAATPQSGLYVVTLSNVEPISANAHDPRNAGTSIRVSRDHIKFGKAQSLDARKKNYWKTFGEHNVNFCPIAAVAAPDLNRAERLVSDRLRPHRAEGPSGRVTEWIQGIGPMDVVRVALCVLEEHGISFHRLC